MEGKGKVGEDGLGGADGVTTAVGTDARTTAYAGGPQIVVTPFENANLVLGYNVARFRDCDFKDNRITRDGVYAKFWFKFDQTTLPGWDCNCAAFDQLTTNF
jgi:hypothetical protein